MDISLLLCILQNVMLLSAYLEDKKRGSGSLFKEFQEVWHHHFSTISSIPLLSGT